MKPYKRSIRQGERGGGKRRECAGGLAVDVSKKNGSYYHFRSSRNRYLGEKLGSTLFKRVFERGGKGGWRL